VGGHDLWAPTRRFFVGQGCGRVRRSATEDPGPALMSCLESTERRRRRRLDRCRADDHVWRPNSADRTRPTTAEDHTTSRLHRRLGWPDRAVIAGAFDGSRNWRPPIRAGGRGQPRTRRRCQGRYGRDFRDGPPVLKIKRSPSAASEARAGRLSCLRGRSRHDALANAAIKRSRSQPRPHLDDLSLMPRTVIESGPP
jgi:hypothetical protein